MESLQKAPCLNVGMADLPGCLVIFLTFRQFEMRNTKLDVPRSEKAELFKQISLRLRYSGSEQYRQQVIDSVLAINQSEDPRCAIHTPGRTYKVQCLACKVSGPDQVPEAEE